MTPERSAAAVRTCLRCGNRSLVPHGGGWRCRDCGADEPAASVRGYQGDPRTGTRSVSLSVLAKTEADARELLLELADDPRIVAAHVELGGSKYLIPVEVDRG